jgi:DNA-directed RNA polymerase specialized sigma24 family protein
MTMNSGVADEDAGEQHAFATTRWSLILSAAKSEAGERNARNALEELCRSYWRPVFLFICRRGYSTEDAQDLTQGFFVHLIETRAYARADREKGHFRSFLLGTLKHFIADVRDHGAALKRGGGMIPEKLDDKAIAEVAAQIGRAAGWRSEEVFDREWAGSLVRKALDRLQQECTLAGKAELLGYLVPYFAAAEESAIPYDEMARRSHRPVTTLRSDVARLRARYRAILREEVRDTVHEEKEVDDELRYLYRALAVA